MDFALLKTQDVWDWHVYTAIFKTHNQQGATVKNKKLKLKNKKKLRTFQLQNKVITQKLSFSL